MTKKNNDEIGYNQIRLLTRALLGRVKLRELSTNHVFVVTGFTHHDEALLSCVSESRDHAMKVKSLNGFVVDESIT